MSWLQVYTLRLRCHEQIAASGRVVFVIQLRFGQQDGPQATDLARRSYSEFRALWKDLLRVTSANVDAINASNGDHSRASRRFSGRESWSSVSKLLSSPFTNGATSSGRERGATKRVKYCRCTQTSCPFQRLHHLLKEFPFPGKHLLQLKDAKALQQRRAALEDFLMQLQRFFCGYPRSFLETAASTQRCQVLQLISAFAGMDVRPASLSVVEDPFSHSFSPGRARYFSYCASPPASPSPTLLTSESVDSTEETLLTEESATDNQRDHDEPPNRETETETDPRPSVCEPRTTLSAAALPSLQVKSALVETFDAALDDVRANLLRQMGADVQAAIARNQLSDEQQWQFALFHAAERGLYADVVTILRRGTDVNSTTWSDTTPLHAASGAGQVHVVQCLLSHGANVDSPGPMGMTPLMYAVNNTQLEVTRVLLRAGADVGLCNLRNVSPVHLAVANSSMPMLLLLLDHGATVDEPNTINGRTPLDIATEAGNVQMCQILLKYGTRGSQCSASGRDTQRRAGDKGHWRIEELCSQYRRGNSAGMLEGIEEDRRREDADAEDAREPSEPRFGGPLDYIDRDDGVTTHQGATRDDVSLETKEGRVYAVL